MKKKTNPIQAELFKEEVDDSLPFVFDENRTYVGEFYGIYGYWNGGALNKMDEIMKAKWEETQNYHKNKKT